MRTLAVLGHAFNSGAALLCAPRTGSAGAPCTQDTPLHCVLTLCPPQRPITAPLSACVTCPPCDRVPAHVDLKQERVSLSSALRRLLGYARCFCCFLAAMGDGDREGSAWQSRGACWTGSDEDRQEVKNTDRKWRTQTGSDEEGDWKSLGIMHAA